MFETLPVGDDGALEGYTNPRSEDRDLPLTPVGQECEERMAASFGLSRQFRSPAGHSARSYEGVYWMISSARPNTDCGIVRPRAFAVFRLITSSNLVGCSTGRSAGFVPLRILSMYLAARRNKSG